MVRKYLYGNRESGIKFFDFQTSELNTPKLNNPLFILNILFRRRFSSRDFNLVIFIYRVNTGIFQIRKNDLKVGLRLKFKTKKNLGILHSHAV